MALLLTGGTGKTGRRISELAQAANVPHVVATRSPHDTDVSSRVYAKFDWHDKSTWDAPFKSKLGDVGAIWLVNPEVEEPAPIMNEFISHAVKKYNVNRFVLLGAPELEPGGPWTGDVWQYLIELGTENSVVKANWFLDNLLESPQLQQIIEEDALFTATQNGKIAWITAYDIGSLGFNLLIRPAPLPKELYAVGEERMAYDEIAALLTTALGRQIRHDKVPTAETVRRFKALGVSDFIANFMGWYEEQSAANEWADHKGSVREVTGKGPVTAKEFIDENAQAWKKK